MPSNWIGRILLTDKTEVSTEDDVKLHDLIELNDVGGAVVPVDEEEYPVLWDKLGGTLGVGIKYAYFNKSGFITVEKMSATGDFAIEIPYSKDTTSGTTLFSSDTTSGATATRLDVTDSNILLVLGGVTVFSFGYTTPLDERHVLGITRVGTLVSLIIDGVTLSTGNSSDTLYVDLIGAWYTGAFQTWEGSAERFSISGLSFSTYYPNGDCTFNFSGERNETDSYTSTDGHAVATWANATDANFAIPSWDVAYFPDMPNMTPPTGSHKRYKIIADST